MDKVNGQRVSAILVMTNKEKTLLTVNVSVEPFSEVGKEVRITTKDILQHLSEKEKEVCKCIQSSVISNTSENSLFGTWVFELPEAERMVVVDEPVEPRYNEGGSIALQAEQTMLEEQETVSEENSSQDDSDSKPKKGRRRIVKKEE